MRRILVIGAGRSASSLIKYLLDNASAEQWHVTVGDRNIALAKESVGNHEHGEAVEFDAMNVEQRRARLENTDFVISMLPAHFHIEVARDCIELKKDIITPSYITPQMKELHQAAKDAGIIILNEMGVDPGIDHMSAMRVLDKIHEDGGKMECFESFTGGLVAPESDNNPWNYKFTWNPRNVVLAGQGGAVKFVQQGRFKYIPYHKLFRRTEIIEIEGYGKFEGYANRDSLKYRDIYGLQDIPTIYRGTFRKPGFCRAWDVFVQLGLTDDSYVMEDSENMTYRQYINSFLKYNPTDSVELKLRYYLNIQEDNPLWHKLEWLGIFSDTKIGLKEATPAQILQKILEEKWSLDKGDKDMIVMWHKFLFKEENGKEREINSSMVCIGDDQVSTAMAKTVGLPVAIATKLILSGKITEKGVMLPIARNIYEPVLNELEEFGIHFSEREVEPKGY